VWGCGGGVVLSSCGCLFVVVCGLWCCSFSFLRVVVVCLFVRVRDLDLVQPSSSG